MQDLDMSVTKKGRNQPKGIEYEGKSWVSAPEPKKMMEKRTERDKQRDSRDERYRNRARGRQVVLTLISAAGNSFEHKDKRKQADVVGLSEIKEKPSTPRRPLMPTERPCLNLV